MAACKRPEFDTPKYFLKMNDNLTTKMIMKHLRNVKQDVRAKIVDMMTRSDKKKKKPSKNKSKIQY